MNVFGWLNPPERLSFKEIAPAAQILRLRKGQTVMLGSPRNFRVKGVSVKFSVKGGKRYFSEVRCQRWFSEVQR